jgi:Protein of unknown function (DUF1569)
MDSDLESLLNVLQTATEGMSEKELQWRPAGKWSVAEVLEHLYLTYTGTIKGFERLLGAGKPLASRASLKQRVQASFVFSFNYLPPGRKALPQTMPRGLATERIKTEMYEKIAAMDQIIQECERRFGTGPLLDHPILGPLTAKRWRRFHLIHGRHHARQIAHLG